MEINFDWSEADFDGKFVDQFLPSGKKSPKKQSERVRFLLIRHSKYNAMFSKIYSYRPLFGLFGPLGIVNIIIF